SAPASFTTPATAPVTSEQPSEQHAISEQLASDVQISHAAPEAQPTDDQRAEPSGQSDMPTVNHMDPAEPARPAAADRTERSPSPQRAHSEQPQDN
ncbi:MAG: hypothetical protein KDE46_31165, partial [Caldilineaceae bacterium]|nr:hypothetical protein [Caldilineaceae bacterium]